MDPGNQFPSRGIVPWIKYLYIYKIAKTNKHIHVNFGNSVCVMAVVET